MEGQFVASWRQRLMTPAVFKGPEADQQVSKFFDNDVGIFVEVGANDPIVGSQTYDLEQRGWRGILVEPLRECAERLRNARSAKVFEVAAGAPADCGKNATLLVLGTLSTVLPSVKQDVDVNERRLVPVRTLDSMLRDAEIERVDFVSIDVEGAELDVLKGLSLDHFRPRLVLVEDDAHTRDKHAYMTRCGYKLVRRTNLNSWYVPDNAEFRVSLFGHWQLFRKFYLGAPLRRWKLKFRRLRRRKAAVTLAGEGPTPYGKGDDRPS